MVSPDSPHRRVLHYSTSAAFTDPRNSTSSSHFTPFSFRKTSFFIARGNRDSKVVGKQSFAQKRLALVGAWSVGEGGT